VDAAKIDTTFKQRKLFYRNLRNGAFEEVSGSSGPAFLKVHSSRGAAAADLHNDGRLAVAINEMNDPPSLLLAQNSERHHWIGIRTVGKKSNRSGIGTRVMIQAGGLTQMDEVRSGGSYFSQNDLRLHFGLGSNKKVDRLTVRWPSGLVDRFDDVPTDQQIIVEEGASVWQSANATEKK